MNRDEMIEVAARARFEARAISMKWDDLGGRHQDMLRQNEVHVVAALIAAGIIPDPETTVTVDRGRWERVHAFALREFDEEFTDVDEWRNLRNARLQSGDLVGQSMLANLKPLPDENLPFPYIQPADFTAEQSAQFDQLRQREVNRQRRKQTPPPSRCDSNL